MAVLALLATMGCFDPPDEPAASEMTPFVAPVYEHPAEVSKTGPCSVEELGSDVGFTRPDHPNGGGRLIGAGMKPGNPANDYGLWMGDVVVATARDGDACVWQLSRRGKEVELRFTPGQDPKPREPTKLGRGGMRVVVNWPDWPMNEVAKYVAWQTERQLELACESGDRTVSIMGTKPMTLDDTLDGARDQFAAGGCRIEVDGDTVRLLPAE